MKITIKTKIALCFIILVGLLSTNVSAQDYAFPNNGTGIKWGDNYSRIMDDGHLRILTDDFFYIGRTANGTLVSTTIFANVASGYVGIGTENPSAKLHVTGRILSDAVDGGLWLSNTKDGFVGNNGTNFGFWSATQGWNTFNINKSNGNIGIGTATPDAKLTVAGNIKAREVEVKITAGADFVFEENYDLPKLNEVEAFVKAKKHLPGIQSEKDMQENGLNLNEMNIRLLQKVEELTLYIIDLEKRVNKVEQSK